jgi:hypothetical protein
VRPRVSAAGVLIDFEGVMNITERENIRSRSKSKVKHFRPDPDALLQIHAL